MTDIKAQIEAVRVVTNNHDIFEQIAAVQRAIQRPKSELRPSRDYEQESIANLRRRDLSRTRMIGERGGGEWGRAGRPRVDLHPTQRKLLYERAVDG